MEDMAEKLKVLLDNMSQEEFDKEWKEVTDLNLTQDNIMVIGIGGNQSHLLDIEIKRVLSHMAGFVYISDNKPVEIYDPESIDVMLATMPVETKEKLLENLEKVIELRAPQSTDVIPFVCKPEVDFGYIDDNRFKNDVWRKKNKKCKGGQFFHK